MQFGVCRAMIDYRLPKKMSFVTPISHPSLNDIIFHSDVLRNAISLTREINNSNFAGMTPYRTYFASQDTGVIALQSSFAQTNLHRFKSTMASFPPYSYYVQPHPPSFSQTCRYPAFLVIFWQKRQDGKLMLCANFGKLHQQRVRLT